MTPTRSRILVVEDEPIVAADLEQTLADLGYQVPGTASSAAEAVSLARTHRPDLALMDITINGPVGGIEAARAISAEFGIPVVFLTAHSDEATLSRAKRVMPYGYLIKPFQNHEIHSTIEMALIRHDAEVRLRKMERWLDTTVRSIGDAVISADVDGRIKLMNPAAEELTGWTSDEAVGEQLHAIFRVLQTGSAGPIDDLIARVVAANDVIRLDETYLNVRKDSTHRPIVDSIAPVRASDGRITGVVIVCRDNSAKLRADEEARRHQEKLQHTQKLESLGILAGGIAHDFNNILTGVIGHASLARLESSPGSKVHAYLDEIDRAAHRAAELCKQMLAYSGRGRFVVQPVDLGWLVEDVTQLLILSISKKVELVFRLAPNLPAVTGDESQLRQVVMNLVINASESMADRTGTVTLSTGLVHAYPSFFKEAGASSELPEGDYVYLEVGDTGTGIAPENVRRIFDPFFTTKFTGRGLGLAAALGIVRGHNGAVTVRSEVGRGTSFRILFPAGAEVAKRKTPANDHRDPWRGSGTVLLVDDEDLVRSTARRIVKSLGFDCVEAANGLEAVEIYKKDPGRFVLTVIDLTMPQLDGAETFQELRRINPEARVILMSGYSEREATERFTRAGLAGFLQKPFDVASFRTVLRMATR